VGNGGSSETAGAAEAGEGGAAAEGNSGAHGGKGGSGATGGSTHVTHGTGATGGTKAEAGTNGNAGDDGEGGEGATQAEGGASSGGTSGMGGTGGMETGGGKSSLPAPPTAGVPKPSGKQGNLQIVSWAGFKGALSFTFDDSLQSQINHYADLNGVGVPMTFYLVCANDGGKAAWQTAANDGHELGNHTMHHCNTDGSSCGWGTFTGVDAELDDCQTHLETAYGIQGPYSMAAPNGDPGWEAPATSRFLLNRGVYDNPAGVKPNDSTDPYNLPCHIAAQGETAVGGFNTVTDDVRANGKWRIILNHSLSLTSPDGYHPVDAAEVVTAMTYARDLGDVWIGTVTTIGAYWRAQKLISALQPSHAGDDLVYSWTLPDHFPPGQYLRVKVDGGTVKQLGSELSWDEHGYYEVALDAGSVTISP
jgi:peptidoglycan/xylan/chitin deacetylase (PgdA/CDA1 family)